MIYNQIYITYSFIVLSYTTCYIYVDILINTRMTSGEFIQKMCCYGRQSSVGLGRDGTSVSWNVYEEILTLLCLFIRRQVWSVLQTCPICNRWETSTQHCRLTFILYICNTQLHWTYFHIIYCRRFIHTTISVTCFPTAPLSTTLSGLVMLSL